MQAPTELPSSPPTSLRDLSPSAELRAKLNKTLKKIRKGDEKAPPPPPPPPPRNLEPPAPLSDDHLVLPSRARFPDSDVEQPEVERPEKSNLPDQAPRIDLTGETPPENPFDSRICVSLTGPVNPIFLPPPTFLWRQGDFRHVHRNFHRAWELPFLPFTDAMRKRKRLCKRVLKTVSNIIVAANIPLPAPAECHQEIFASFVEFALAALEDRWHSDAGISASSVLPIAKRLADATSEEVVEKCMVDLFLCGVQESPKSAQDLSADFMLFFLKVRGCEHYPKISRLRPIDYLVLAVILPAIETSFYLLIWDAAATASGDTNPFIVNMDRITFYQAMNSSYNTIAGLLVRTREFLPAEPIKLVPGPKIPQEAVFNRSKEPITAYDQPQELVKASIRLSSLQAVFSKLMGLLRSRAIKICSSTLPAIDLSVFRDDIANQTPGYSFLAGLPQIDDLWRRFVALNPHFESAPDKKTFQLHYQSLEKYQMLLIAVSMLFLGEASTRLVRLVPANGSLLARNFFISRGKMYLVWKDRTVAVRCLPQQLSFYWALYMLFLKPFKQKLDPFAREFQAIPDIPTNFDPPATFTDIFRCPVNAADVNHTADELVRDLVDIPFHALSRAARQWRILFDPQTGEGEDGWFPGLKLQDLSQLRLADEGTADSWFEFLSGWASGTM